jgi:hypothetical protein
MRWAHTEGTYSNAHEVPVEVATWRDPGVEGWMILQDRQCTYKAMLRRVRVTTVAVGKQ